MIVALITLKEGWHNYEQQPGFWLGFTWNKKFQFRENRNFTEVQFYDEKLLKEIFAGESSKILQPRYFFKTLVLVFRE